MRRPPGCRRCALAHVAQRHGTSQVTKAYGEKWYRVWLTFLSWSVLIAERGGSTCFQIVANSYPHSWPWTFNLAREDSPFRDIRVRHAINYCVNRDGLVTLLNGLAEPAYGLFKKADVFFGKPKQQYGYDPAKGKALLKEAGYGPDKPVKAKIMITTSGSGQMLPLPMNEFLQQNLKECNFDISFEVVDWGSMLVPGQTAQPQSAGRATISFAASRPSETLFPMEEFRRSCEEVIGGPEIAAILQLGSPGGYEPLRQYLMAEARRQGAMGPGDDLIVTSGCQQALALLQRVLVKAGDTVAIEDPVYPGVKNLFSFSGALTAGVRVGAEGIDLDELERTIERDRPKALVITPNFQNPTGATVPLAARQALLRMTRAAGVVLIENDTYGDLRYEGSAIPSIKQLDGSTDTILLRSFSKVAFPGLRVGWAIGPRAVIARMAEVKQLTDLHSDQLSQAVLLRFAESGRLEAHRRKTIEAGGEKLKAALKRSAEIH